MGNKACATNKPSHAPFGQALENALKLLFVGTHLCIIWALWGVSKLKHDNE